MQLRLVIVQQEAQPVASDRAVHAPDKQHRGPQRSGRQRQTVDPAVLARVHQQLGIVGKPALHVKHPDSRVKTSCEEMLAIRHQGAAGHGGECAAWTAKKPQLKYKPHSAAVPQKLLALARENVHAHNRIGVRAAENLCERRAQKRQWQGGGEVIFQTITNTIRNQQHTSVSPQNSMANTFWLPTGSSQPMLGARTSAVAEARQ